MSDNISPESISPGQQYSLAGPTRTRGEPALPVRGDLAHVRLAGHCFVPHYAVPMPRTVVAGGAVVRKAGRADGEAVAELPGGAQFDVLDIAGEWSWGEYGEGGPVGYVALGDLAPIA